MSDEVGSHGTGDSKARQGIDALPRYIIFSPKFDGLHGDTHCHHRNPIPGASLDTCSSQAKKEQEPPQFGTPEWEQMFQ